MRTLPALTLPALVAWVMLSRVGTFLLLLPLFATWVLSGVFPNTPDGRTRVTFAT